MAKQTFKQWRDAVSKEFKECTGNALDYSDSELCSLHATGWSVEETVALLTDDLAIEIYWNFGFDDLHQMLETNLGFFDDMLEFSDMFDDTNETDVHDGLS